MKNKLLAIVAVCTIMLTAGCGNNDYLLDEDKNVIVYTETGQQLRNDILCKPSEGTEIYDLYKEHENQLSFSLDKLPTCENFKVNSNKTDSMWELIFVKPTAFAITSIGNIVINLGIAVILVGILIRLILLPLQIKTSKQSINMRKAGPELKKLDKKYENKKDNESQLLKSQEMMAVYKKYNINPLAGCLPALIQLPIFFAFLDAIYRIPSIYEGKLLGYNLGMTPYTGITNGEYQYILLMLMIAGSTYLSFKHTMSQNPQTNDESEKQMKTMLNFMTIFILISSLFFPTALHFYWIVTYVFIAIQTTIINKILGEKEPKNTKKEKTKKDLPNKNTKVNIKEKLDKKEGKKNGKTSK
ncbi:MAG: YidC/Oxa1 family membrane protein insertase [bacterium]